MLIGEVRQQSLQLEQTYIVAETIDYLEARFAFRTDDWNGMDKWVHFARKDGTEVYDIRLTDDCIRKEDHLNLSNGKWSVYLHGNRFVNGEMVERITTGIKTITVERTGMFPGEPFPSIPPSAGEQVVAQATAAAEAAEASAREAEDSALGAGIANKAAEAAQDAAESARDDAISAKNAAETAQAEAETARDAAEKEKESAQAARVGAETAAANAENAKSAAEKAKADAEDAKTAAETAQKNAEAAASSADSSATAASGSASASASSERNAAASETGAAAAAKEAKDLRDGIAQVIEDKKDAVIAEVESAGDAKLDEISAAGAVLYSTQELTPEQQSQARANIGTIAAEDVVEITAEEAREIWENTIRSRNLQYCVSGVGGQSTTLTRLWSAAGKTAAAGTDTDAPINDFDNLAPFNRRKCVGTWSKPDASGKAHFTVKAYYGDRGYTEDGTMGDYVAVEVEPFWYYQDLEAGIIGVSPKRQYNAGWKIHPVCVDEDGNIREKTYLPCYSLAVNEDGHAVSLPGYHPSFGSYKGLRDIARTYGGGNTAAILEPMAVRHYEWLLFTVEYATTNAQSIMQGASAMPCSADDKVSASGENVNHVIVTAAIGNKFVDGQSIYLGTTYSTTPKDASDYNVITAIENCDADGNTDAGGTYRRITFDGIPRAVTADTTTISTRPWKTGECAKIRTPSGSPVSNTDAKHPMQYRWRENIWANQHSTCNDLFCTLEGAGTDRDPYHVVWHFLTDPAYYPSSTSKPDRTDFATAAFYQLAQDTEHVSGYIKVMEADPEYPHCIIPVIQIGDNNSTYYADYAYIVNGVTQVRAVRLGGYLKYGTVYGLLSFNAYNLPSISTWDFSGGLYFRQ